MDISFVISTRNNLKYLKWSYDSIRKNQGNHTVWLCYGLDACNDGTKEWIQKIQETDSEVVFIENDTDTRVGHTIMYDRIINELVETDLAMIFHSDMYLCEGALDAIEKTMHKRVMPGIQFDADDIVPIGIIRNKRCIVSLTRIEPPLHPAGKEKIVVDFGTEPENFDENKLLEYTKGQIWRYIRDHGNPNLNPTNGVFAPWAFWVDEFKEIGGHDPLFAPQSKEDSDIFNRFQLNRTEFLQTWKGFVYHLTCRGSRFAPSLTTPGTNSQEWENQNIKSSRNFIRKWGHFVQHDEYLNPIIPHKYDIMFVVKNCTSNLLYNLEPWCDNMSTDLNRHIVDRYIEFEQLNTKIDLYKKFFNYSRLPDIIVQIDGYRLTDDDWNNIQNLSEIITNSCDGPGEYELGNLKLNVRELKHYEQDLIVCKN